MYASSIGQHITANGDHLADRGWHDQFNTVAGCEHE